MKPDLTKADYAAWKARWKAVAEKEAELLRATPNEVLLRQFLALWRTARRENWMISDLEEDEEVRRRWRVLREKHRARLQNGTSS